MDNEINNVENSAVNGERELSEQMQIRRGKLAELRAAGKDPYLITRYDVDCYSSDIKDNFEAFEGKTVSVAGRMMGRRDMGKACFVGLFDSKGKIQLYVRIDDVGEDDYKSFKKWDIGDILGVKGFVFKTRTGEVSVHCTHIELLSKCLIPFPEKWHGLSDQDLRYRRRYVDLNVNPQVKEAFVKRSKIISSIRSFLEGRGFLEVETPVLHNQAGGAAARPFITHHNTLDIDMYLRIALELHLKRLIVGGFDRVFEIGRVFRNEGMDQKHNPEFTELELYQAYTDINGMMEITETMMREVAHKVNGTGLVRYGDREIDLDRPFEKITMTDAVRQYSGVDFSKITTLGEARAAAKEHGVEYEERHKIGDILSAFFDEFVEDKLIQPTFITGHHVDISPLAKRDPANPQLTQRFELFINGCEYANAFSELNDPIDQRERFEAQAKLKAQGDEEACGVDEDFLMALEYGMPPTGGLGIGVDRFVMLLTDSQSIRDVLLFPTMKPIGGEQ